MNLSFSLGNLYKFFDERKTLSIKDTILLIEELNVDGIEYNMGLDLYSRTLRIEGIELLKKFNYASIHFPFNLVKNSASEKHLIRDFNYIEKFYKEIKAENFVIHPQDVLSRKIIENSKMNFLTENMENKLSQKRKAFEKVLKENENIGLCLDVSHTYT